MKVTPPLPVERAKDQNKKTATGVDDSEQPGECNEEIEDLVKKEIDVSRLNMREENERKVYRYFSMSVYIYTGRQQSRG